MTLLDKKIGILGGGQLAKMMAQAAKQFDLYVAVVDQTLDCPAHSVVDSHIHATFTDPEAIRELADEVDVITCDIEHVNVQPLLELADEGVDIQPHPRTLALVQDKIDQNQHFADHNLPVPKFAHVETISDVETYGETWGYPIMVKGARGGYDGRGNYLVETRGDIPKALSTLGVQCDRLFVEEHILFAKEISVLVCRDRQGHSQTYPVGENVHRESILKTTVVPAPITDEQLSRSRRIAEQAVATLEGAGIFCVELFLTGDGEIYINEVAPRPHNSGHYTIEGCVTSQFANHIRAVVGLPLGETRLVTPSAMFNLIGDDSGTGRPQYQGIEEVLGIDGVHVHIYGKGETRPRRKMGHITIEAPTEEEVAERLARVAKAVKVVPGAR